MLGWTVPGYTETRVLGSGGTGRIVEAVQDRSGERVAITYPGAMLRSDEAFRRRLRADAQLLTGLEHPNVVRVRELVETGTAVALITDAVDGAALRRVLAASGPLSERAALAILRGVLLGLAAAAELGVVHRDCQPSNVMVGAEGVVALTGFGLAVRTEAMMPAAGTPSHMAPELWEGATPRPATDLYAATATFYECLTGRVPYLADSVFELQTMHRAAPIPVADVPPALGPLLAQGLAKAPVERPADAAGFLAELEAAAALEFGLEWEERGRRELAALVAELPGDDGKPGLSESPTAVPPVAAPQAVSADPDTHAASGTVWLEEQSPAQSEGMGRGTKAGVAVAAVAVLGTVVAAVAFTPGKRAAAAAGPSGGIVSATSDQNSTGDDGTAPGVPAGGAPTSGSARTEGGSGPKPTTGGTSAATSATGPVRAVTSLTPIGLLPASLNSTLPGPGTPFPPPPSSTPATTPAGSGGPTTTSGAVTVSASASMSKSTYSGPCPPTDPPAGTVTFTVGGLPADGTETISYRWQVVGSGSGGTAGGSGVGSGSGQVVAHDGSTTAQFTITDDGHTQKELSGTVEIVWSAPGTSGGTTDAGSVDLICSPGSGSSSGGGPTSAG